MVIAIRYAAARQNKAGADSSGRRNVAQLKSGRLRGKEGGEKEES